jgi:hypothetical protein
MPSPFELLPVDSPAPMILSWVIAFLICSIIIELKSISRKNKNYNLSNYNPPGRCLARRGS